MTNFDSLLKTISEAPPNEMSPALALKVKHLMGTKDKDIVATELKEIHEQIKKDPSLGSDFAMWILVETIAIAETK